MTSKENQPATPLPWRSGPASTRDGNNLGHRGIWTVDKRRGIADVFVRADAEYLAHACNAYPRLVEALRALHECTNMDSDGDYFICAEAGGAVDSAYSLLRELGESK